MYAYAGNVINFLEEYGWYILISLVIGIYVYNKYLKDKFQEYKRWKSEQEYAAKYHKNPDILLGRINAQKTYADKLQEKYNQEVEEHKKKLEEKESQKREALLNKLEGKTGNKLGTSKSDYNPLMGAGTSGGYKPPKRSCCKKGGGCG